jgi:hypothetical protein
VVIRGNYLGGAVFPGGGDGRCGGAGASCLGGMRARPSRSACRGICVCRTLTHQTNASGCLFYTARRGGRWEVARRPPDAAVG